MRSKISKSRWGQKQGTLILVGGGYAHGVCLARWAAEGGAPPHTQIVLDKACSVYTGGLPAWIAGKIAKPAMLDMASMALRAGVVPILAQATKWDPKEGLLYLDQERPPLRYRPEVDALSLNIGAAGIASVKASVKASAKASVKASAKLSQHRLIPTRPGHLLLEGLEDIVRQVDLGLQPQIIVVGAGPAGVELGLALATRMQRQAADPLKPKGCIWIVDAAAYPLPRYAPAARRWALARFKAHGIRFLGNIVANPLGWLQNAELLAREIEPTAAEAVALGAPLFVLAALPGKTHSLLAGVDEAGLQGGRLRVERTLQSVRWPGVFAAGDCAWIEPTPSPQSGVWAVRAGPVLAKNLRRWCLKAKLKAWKPQKHALSLVVDGEHAFAGKGRWVWAPKARWLRLGLGAFKHAIDQRFVRRFDLPDAGARARMLADEALGLRPEMLCGGCAAKVSQTALEAGLETGLQTGLEPSAKIQAKMQPCSDAAWAPLPTSQKDTSHQPGFWLSTDHFPWLVGDPYKAGALAMAHAASDLGAFGHRPNYALAHIALSQDDLRPAETLAQAMAGMDGVLRKQGGHFCGGHTGLAAEPSLGVTVLAGRSQSKKFYPGSRSEGFDPKACPSPKVGDLLVATRPLGSGIVHAAYARGWYPTQAIEEIWTCMLQPLDETARLLIAHQASWLTDLSGFGLGGHLLRALKAAGVSAHLWPGDWPRYPHVDALIRCGLRSSGHARLQADLLGRVAVMHRASQGQKGSKVWLRDARYWPALLCDPQTCGGILATLPPAMLPYAQKALHAKRLGCGLHVLGKIAEHWPDTAQDGDVWLHPETFKKEVL